LYNNSALNTTRELLDRAPPAKTMFPGCGDLVIGIDTTENGQWVLATCKTYLLLIPTTFSGTTGFEKTMGKEKPAPRRLELLPRHLKAMGGNVCFTPAKFNRGKTGQERSIVTTTGPFIINWNFRKAKQNQLKEYTIRKSNETIIADEYKCFGEDKEIVVAMPNDLRVAVRNQNFRKN